MANLKKTDELYMRRCLQLASLGQGHVSPNPMVGAVIVCDGKIIGEGYHRKCGEFCPGPFFIEAVYDICFFGALFSLWQDASMQPVDYRQRNTACGDRLPRPFPGGLGAWSGYAAPCRSRCESGSIGERMS